MSTKQSAFPENAKRRVSRVFSTTSRDGITEIREADSYIDDKMRLADMSGFDGSGWKLTRGIEVYMACTVENQKTHDVTTLCAHAFQYDRFPWQICLGKHKTIGYRTKTMPKETTAEEIQQILLEWAKTTKYRVRKF